MSTLNTGNISGDPSFNTTGAVKLPVGSTGQRPGSPREGDLRYNNSISQLEIYANGLWHAIGGVLSPFSATFYSLFSSPNRTAPTTVGSYYNSSPLSGNISLSGGKQAWSVPSSGWYRFNAYGAQGGTNQYYQGGGGARIQGDFFLEQGEVINVLCGSAGVGPNYEDCDCGGGGGTYVVKASGNNVSDILLIAAGGGGASNGSFNSQGCGTRSQNTTTGACGKDGSASVNGLDGRAGRGGTGGYAGDRALSGSNRGNPGGGFYGGGFSYSQNPTWSETRAGQSYMDGSLGGTANQSDSFGGFGGGGGGHGNCFISGGGGGGYNGGGCEVQYSSYHGGQGGGSINNGINKVGQSGANYNGNAAQAGNQGYCEVTKISGG